MFKKYFVSDNLFYLNKISIYSIHVFSVKNKNLCATCLLTILH